MTTLSEVRIAAGNPARTTEVFRAICDVEPELGDTGESLFRLGDAILVVASGAGADGVESIGFKVTDPATREQKLIEAGMAISREGPELTVDPSITQGVRVRIQGDPESTAVANRLAGPAAAARLDHVALLAGDLAAASASWAIITDQPVQQMGLHPVSGGAFSAARVLLGSRMIELLTPVPGVTSALADRLASRGEGVAALALPVVDLEVALARLERIGARVLNQAPHRMVHPKDAGGVLVQLTPRVDH
jgi:catechol 2,3-dioxygenase-like lactoylglutathione lyase family enzyme